MRDEIRQVLFEIGRELKVHKLSGDNLIIEIDYERYVDQLEAIMISKGIDES